MTTVFVFFCLLLMFIKTQNWAPDWVLNDTATWCLWISDTEKAKENPVICNLRWSHTNENIIMTDYDIWTSFINTLKRFLKNCNHDVPVVVGSLWWTSWATRPFSQLHQAPSNFCRAFIVYYCMTGSCWSDESEHNQQTLAAIVLFERNT